MFFNELFNYINNVLSDSLSNLELQIVSFWSFFFFEAGFILNLIILFLILGFIVPSFFLFNVFYFILNEIILFFFFFFELLLSCVFNGTIFGFIPILFSFFVFCLSVFFSILENIYCVFRKQFFIMFTFNYWEMDYIFNIPIIYMWLLYDYINEHFVESHWTHWLVNETPYLHYNSEFFSYLDIFSNRWLLFWENWLGPFCYLVIRPILPIYNIFHFFFLRLFYWICYRCFKIYFILCNIYISFIIMNRSFFINVSYNPFFGLFLNCCCTYFILYIRYNLFLFFNFILNLFFNLIESIISLL